MILKGKDAEKFLKEAELNETKKAPKEEVERALKIYVGYMRTTLNEKLKTKNIDPNAIKILNDNFENLLL